jgi:hypothetical protein
VVFKRSKIETYSIALLICSASDGVIQMLLKGLVLRNLTVLLSILAWVWAQPYNVTPKVK